MAEKHPETEHSSAKAHIPPALKCTDASQHFSGQGSSYLRLVDARRDTEDRGH
jgi:hypothetical protein